MKRNIFIITLILLVSACNESFLDLSSKTEIAASSLYKSEKDIQLVLNGIYKKLQSNSIYGGSYSGGGVCSIVEYDSFSDNTWNWYTAVGPGNFTNGSIDASNNFFKNTWGENYKGIVRCNDAISNLELMPENTITEEKKDEYLGQIFFLRGLFYFHLAVYFEDVPLITESQSLEDPYPSKSEQSLVMEQVISDLTFASNQLPVSYPDNLYGYATKGAAMGILARVHLFNHNWIDAADYAGKVIDLGVYNLNFPFNDQFSPDGEFSGDVVFSVRFEDMPGFNVGELFSRTEQNKADPTHQPLKNLVDDFYCTDGLPIVSSPLYDTENPRQNRDPRLQTTFYFNGDIFNLDLPNFKVNTDTGFGVKKFARNKVSDKGTNIWEPGGQDYYVLRYADVLLMRAEALVELNRDANEVYSLINQVRARVGMPAIEDVEGEGLLQGDLRSIVRHERRVELALEGLRFFDIKRWGIVEEAYSRANVDAVNIPSMPLLVFQGRKSEVFPIHQSELDANPNLIQNDVWK